MLDNSIFMLDSSVVVIRTHRGTSMATKSGSDGQHGKLEVLGGGGGGAKTWLTQWPPC